MLLVDKLVSTLAPHQCIGCGVDGAVLCGICLKIAGEPPAPRCVGCKRLSDEYKTCSNCRSWIDIYAVYVASSYEGAYEILLHEYKFNLKRQAVHAIAHLMSQVPVTFMGEDAVIVPLPTAPARIRQRGFDHGTLLARSYQLRLAKLTGKKVKCSNALSRVSNARQLGSSRAQRIRQVANEFYVKDVAAVKGKTVVLTDDVTTTGASLAAAAKTIKQAGAKRVYAVIFAQKT